MKSSHPLRIVTCCYCGARSTLPAKLKRKERLVCSGCGAAIERIEAIQPVLERARRSGDRAKPAAPHPAERPGDHLPKDRPARRRKGKRRRSMWYNIREAFDDIEDLVDDIFD